MELITLNTDFITRYWDYFTTVLIEYSPRLISATIIFVVGWTVIKLIKKLNIMKYYFEVIKYEIIMLPQLLRYLFSFKKKVLYVGCTGMGNLGDEVVYEATKSLLNQKFIFYKILYSKYSVSSY